VIYATEEQAFRRVETLKQRGVWPGVRTRHDGTSEVTYDPDVLGETPNSSLGSYSELGNERGTHERRWHDPGNRGPAHTEWRKPGLNINPGIVP
jgi:hypothetical protein